MKLNDNFALRQVAGNWVVIPVADKILDFSGILTLNNSGAMLWKVLVEKGDKSALVKALTDAYEVSEQTAAKDVDLFLEKLKQAGCMDE